MRQIIFLALILVYFISCTKPPIFNMSLTPLGRGKVMDPSQIYFLNEYYIIENLTLRLVEMDAKSGYKLMLASSIIEKSPTEYEIRIKETGFSNGEPITLQDVKNSLIRAQSSQNSHVAFKDMVDSIEIESEVLKLKLKKRVNDFMYILSLADLSILHSTQASKKEILVEDWEKVSSGPYRYSVNDNDIFLVRNPHYTLSDIDYIKKVKLHSAKGRDTFADFKNGIIDFGEFNLNSYDSHLSELISEKKLAVIGNDGDMINYLALNIDNPKFKSEYNRKWVQKKVLKNFQLNKQYNAIARKAFQFFTPLAKGYVEESKIIDMVDSWEKINIDVIPEELKSGITISTYQRAFEVTPRGAFNDLEKVLGIPVKMEAVVASPDYQKFLKDRKFEAFLGITSMDQVIVGEAINLRYFSSSPTFKDPKGKMRKLMDQYQHSDHSQSVQIVNRMALQMIEDSECVPLFYVASPFFYNKEKIDISHLDEMTYFNLWKMKEK